MLKRMISLLLCAVMLASVLPAQAIALETEEEAAELTLEEVTATEEGTEPTEEETEPAEAETDPVVEETEPMETETGSIVEETEPTETETDSVVEETESAEDETETEEPELISLEAPELDEAELLMGYLSPLYHGDGGSFFGTAGRDRLSAANQYLYDGLKEAILRIAAGLQPSTTIVVDFSGTAYKRADADSNQVLRALVLDLPFEMYWYDGAQGWLYTNKIELLMQPNKYYQAAGFDAEDPYIDTAKARNAAAAAENIFDIKTKYEASSDYDKLCAYADEICALVEYDHYAADNKTYTTDISPWTLINVFDGDTATNVVCEGYAEAYQYLCDESIFQGDVVCISATGNAHKWNIIRIDGVGYLMDVTHCDYGDYAYRGPKFFGGGSGSVAEGYVIGGFHYWYDPNYTLPVYGDGEDSVLKLSATAYTPPVTCSIVYDANGGTGAPGSQLKTVGVDLILRDTVPVWDGYTFLGWATTSTATAAEYQPGDAYTADGDVTLYAVWRLTDCDHSFVNFVCEYCGLPGGSCGDALTWSYDVLTQTLTISGTGEMQNYSKDAGHLAPWTDFGGEIKKLVVEEGVAGIGDCAFVDCSVLETASFPSSLLRVGDSAFYKEYDDACKGFWSEINQTVRQWSAVQIGENNEYFPNWNSVIFTSQSPVTASGKAGERVYWELTSEGSMVFFGSGDMHEFWATASPYAELDISSVTIGEGITNVGMNAFEVWETAPLAQTLVSVTIASTVESVESMAFANCGALNTIVFTADAPGFGENCFLNVAATAYYPANDPTWTADVLLDYGGTITWVPYGGVENQVTIPAAELNGQTSVWIDGKEYAVNTDSGMPCVDLPNSDAKTMVAYTYQNGDNADVHTHIPTGMKVWTLSNTDGLYTATHVEELDDVLGYAGCSIRVKGNQGIRMVTSLDQADKDALTAAGLAGYTLEEYGTAIAWASQLGTAKPLVLGKSYVSSNYAYKKGVADPIFSSDGNVMQYTNVLVGFSLDQCSDDIAMRPYMILKDAEGNEITLYGAIVERSIGYIALQNTEKVEAGTEAYDYIWKIITHVYGEVPAA